MIAKFRIIFSIFTLQYDANTTNLFPMRNNSTLHYDYTCLQKYHLFLQVWTHYEFCSLTRLERLLCFCIEKSLDLAASIFHLGNHLYVFLDAYLTIGYLWIHPLPKLSRCLSTHIESCCWKCICRHHYQSWTRHYSKKHIFRP